MPSLVTATDHGFTVRVPAWHNLFQTVEEALTAEQAMDIVAPWEVYTSELLTADGWTVPRYKCTRRSDNGAVLGVVGANYQPLQNKDAFAFFDAVCGTGEAKYDTGGTLDEGRKIFLSAKLISEMEVVKGDVISTYLMLSNSHDGSRAVNMQWVPIRTVCDNTLQSAFNWAKKHGNQFKAKHTSGIMSRVTEAQDILGLAHKNHEETAEAFSAMVDIRPTEEQVEEVLQQLFPEVEDAKRDTWSNGRAGVKDLYYNSETCNLSGMEQTGWGLYNAATEYNQYYRRTQTEERMMLSALEGTIAEQNEQAFQYVMALR